MKRESLNMDGMGMESIFQNRFGQSILTDRDSAAVRLVPYGLTLHYIQMSIDNNNNIIILVVLSLFPLKQSARRPDPTVPNGQAVSNTTNHAWPQHFIALSVRVHSH